MVDTLHPPLSVIATWPKPNYTTTDDKGPGLVYTCIIFASIGIVIGASRLYSRLFITKAPGLDDLLVIIALGFLTTLMILVIIGNKDFYSGRHVWDIPPTSFVGSRLNIWACLWCYIIGITLIKISVLLFYRRLSVNFSKTFLIATWIGIAYNILYFMSFGLTLLLICRPLHSYWDSFNPVWAAAHDFHCGAEGVALPASSASSVLGDFYSTLLPLILVYHLELPRRQKFALYGLFALGFMAVAAGIVRTVLMYRLLNVDYDFSRQLWLTWIFAVLELYLALFAASAPSLKPFFRHFFLDSIHSLSKSSRRRQGYGNPRSQEAGTGIGNGEEAGTEISVVGTTTGHHTKGLSADVKGHQPPWRQDPERAESQQSWFLGDQAAAGTKHFELHTSQAGKGLIPMRVYPQSATDNGSSLPEAPSEDPFADPTIGQAQNYSKLTALPRPPRPPPKDWPLPATVMEHPHQPREFLAKTHISSLYNGNT